MGVEKYVLREKTYILIMTNVLKGNIESMS